MSPLDTLGTPGTFGAVGQAHTDASGGTDVRACDGAERIRAQVWLGGDRFELQEFARPEPAPGEALVAVDLATVCGSDVHTVTGRRPGAHPSILGHEAVGRVVATHPEAPTYVDGRVVAVGDRLVWGVTAACGACDRCLAGRTAKCRHLLKTGHEPLGGPWALSGGYASHLVLRRGLALVPVPEVVPDGPAAMAACALATVMACLDARVAGELAGRRVLVVGAGMLGLGACAVAAQAGAASVAVLDPAIERVEQARRFGADGPWGAAGSATGTDASAGEWVDVAVELSGHPASVAAAVDALDIGGRAVLAGSVAPTPAQAFDPERIVRRHLSLIGVHNYEPRHLQEAIDFLAGPGAGYPWGDLIAEPTPLDALPHGMLATGTVLRRSVTP